jgi:hypothetical protein
MMTGNRLSKGFFGRNRCPVPGRAATWSKDHLRRQITVFDLPLPVEL